MRNRRDASKSGDQGLHALRLDTCWRPTLIGQIFEIFNFPPSPLSFRRFGSLSPRACCIAHNLCAMQQARGDNGTNDMKGHLALITSPSFPSHTPPLLCNAPFTTSTAAKVHGTKVSAYFFVPLKTRRPVPATAASRRPRRAAHIYQVFYGNPLGKEFRICAREVQRS